MSVEGHVLKKKIRVGRSEKIFSIFSFYFELV